MPSRVKFVKAINKNIRQLIKENINNVRDYAAEKRQFEDVLLVYYPPHLLIILKDAISVNCCEIGKSKHRKKNKRLNLFETPVTLYCVCLCEFNYT